MIKEAIFAGGCFWCMVKPFDKCDGVISVVAGYTGGHIKNPTYEEVKTQTTGHFEAVKITYDDSKISYEQLLDIYWKQIDPTDPFGQFIDKGSSYKTAIFYNDEDQKQKAELSKKALEKSSRFEKEIHTQILEASEFYEAEEYHQDYYKKNPDEYKKEYEESGRYEFTKDNWDKDNLDK